MAYVPDFFTGWEMGTTKVLGATIELISTASPHTGTYCYYSTTNSSDTAFTFPVARSDINIGFWYKLNGLSDYKDVLLFLSDGLFCRLRFTSGYVNYFINDSLKGTGTVPIISNTWFNIQIAYVVSDTGTFMVKIDGILDLNFSGDTKPGSGTTITKIQFGSQSWAYAANVYVDDFTVGTGGWPGDMRMIALFPTADTATKQFTPSTGTSNFEMVNEVPPNTTDYVYASGTGLIDLYDITDFNATAGVNTYIPQYVNQWMYAWKDPANSQQIKFKQKLGSTTYTSSGIDITNAAAYYYRLFLTDPAGNAWTDGNLDILQIGIESVI